MSRDVTMGQYFPGNSFLHKMDARAKIVLMIAYIVAVFLCDSLYSYLVLGCFTISMILISRVPIKSVIKSLRGILFLVLFTAALNLFFYKEGVPIVEFWIIKITKEGLLFTVKMMLRLILLVSGTTILTLTTTPMSLTDGLESLMKPLKYIKFPVHDIAVIMSLALRLIPTLMEEMDKIILAQKARGANFDTGNIFQKAKAMLPILIPLFVNSFRRADDLALALDARCYNATPNRTKYKVSKLGLRDLIATIAVGMLIFLIAALNAGFWGLI